MEPGTAPHVFISCGQWSDSEKNVGRALAVAVQDAFPGVKGYFAQNVNSLRGLQRNIFEAIDSCVGFVAVIHPRGEVRGGSKKTVRGSVWVEQEIAVTSFLVERLERDIPIVVFVHRSVSIEGLRSLVQLNEPFTEDAEIVPRFLELIAGREFVVERPVRKREVPLRSRRLGFGRIANAYKPGHFAVSIRVEHDQRNQGAPLEPDLVNYFCDQVKHIPGCDGFLGRRELDEVWMANKVDEPAAFAVAPRAIFIQDWGDVVVRWDDSATGEPEEFARVAALAWAVALLVHRSADTDPNVTISVAYRSELLSTDYGTGQAEHAFEDQTSAVLDRTDFGDAFGVIIQKFALSRQRKNATGTSIREMLKERELKFHG